MLKGMAIGRRRLKMRRQPLPSDILSVVFPWGGFLICYANA